MRVSREQMAIHRQSILDSAGKLFRSKGYDAVSVVEIMNAAGLTHGGFYGHFSSKDELVSETLDKLIENAPSIGADFEAYLARYLSKRHRDNPAEGCATAGLASDTRHQKSETRAVMTRGLKGHIENLSNLISGKTARDKRRAAIGCWSAMVGAMIIARAVDDPELSNDILKQTRAWLASVA